MTRPARFKAAVAVYALLRRDGQVLLLRRSGSGSHDGELSLPAGQYSIVGVYPDADPSVSANTVEDGFDYTNCLYVVGP